MENKSFSIVVIINIVAVLILALGTGGYFFWQNSIARSELAAANQEIVDLKVTKSKVEIDLAMLKSTDLAKEVEILKLKLKSAEDNLAFEKRDHGNTQSKLTAAEAKLKTLEMTLKQAKSYTAVLSAFTDWEYSPTSALHLHILDRDTRYIDSAISSLGDSGISDLWREVKANFPEGKQTGNFRYGEVIVLITSKLTNLFR